MRNTRAARILIAVLLLAAALISTINTASAGSVAISPQSPHVGDTLTCDVAGSSSSFDYYWFVNGGQVKHQKAETSTLPTSSYAANSNVKCTAWIPGTNIKIGEDSATLAGYPFSNIGFNINPQSGYAPLSVNYSCHAVGGNPPLSYSISFGDGTSSASSSGSHTYKSVGSYTAKCTATDSTGQKISKSAAVNVNPRPAPTITYTILPHNGTAPLKVNYSCSTTGLTAPVSYDINFGDGVHSSSRSGTHTYMDAGTYLSSCSASDNYGGYSVAFQSITVNKPNMPISSMNFSITPKTGYAPLATSYNCEANGDAPVSYRILFGDGSATTNSRGSHTYSSPGNYTAQCTAKDANGDSKTLFYHVAVMKPKFPEGMSFSIIPREGSVPLATNYYCNATGSSGVTYKINFGDGISSTAQSGSHTYNSVGSFTASCTATDKYGQSKTLTYPITVHNPGDVQITPHEPHDNDALTCDVSGSSSSFTYHWFRNGAAYKTQTAQESTVPASATSIGDNWTCTGWIAGKNIKIGQDSVTIHNQKITELKLIANPDMGLEPLTVNYSCQATGGDTPISYKVTFGDGTTFTSKASGTHVYNDAGNYSLACTATDSNGDSLHAAHTIRVLPRNFLNMTFSVSPNTGRAPLLTNYNCNAIGGTAPITYLVDFGDGSFSSAASGSHIYSNPGSYTAECSAFDAKNKTMSRTQNVNVQPPILPIQVSFNVNPIQGVEPLNSNYGCSATGGLKPFSYNVYFDDGTNSTTPSGTHTYSAGNYTPSCVVTDARNVSAAASAHVSVKKDIPVKVDLNLSSDVDNTALEIVSRCSFTGNTPIAYSVYLDGALKASGNSSSHFVLSAFRFVSEGNHSVTCNATDIDGDTDSVTKSIVAKYPYNNLNATAKLSVNTTSGTAPMNVGYSCVGTGNAPLDIEVSYGDGRTEGGVYNSSSAIDTGYADYTSAGNYTMTCRVTDKDGDVATDTKIISVANAYNDINATAHISTTPQNGSAPLTVNYTCNIGGNPLLSTIVSFGDGRAVGGNYTMSSDNVSGQITYGNPGNYTITCSVTDNDGDTATDSTVVSVAPANNKFTSINFSVVPSSGTAPLQTQYDCSAAGGDAPVSYMITFGDGSLFASSAFGTHTYTTAGNYTATCTATDSNADAISRSVPVNVSKAKPSGSWKIEAQPMQGYAPLAVNFNAKLSNLTAKTPIKWVFGDGHYAYGSSVTHVFILRGTYNVQALFTDSAGNLEQKSVAITVLPSNGMQPTPVDYRNVGISKFAAIRNNDGSVYSSVTIANNAGTDLYNVRVTVTLPDSGLQMYRTINRLEKDDTQTLTFLFPYADMGDSYALVQVGNSRISLSKKTLLI